MTINKSKTTKMREEVMWSTRPVPCGVEMAVMVTRCNYDGVMYNVLSTKGLAATDDTWSWEISVGHYLHKDYS